MSIFFILRLNEECLYQLKFKIRHETKYVEEGNTPDWSIISVFIIYINID